MIKYVEMVLYTYQIVVFDLAIALNFEARLSHHCTYNERSFKFNSLFTNEVNLCMYKTHLQIWSKIMLKDFEANYPSSHHSKYSIRNMVQCGISLSFHFVDMTFSLWDLALLLYLLRNLAIFQ